MDNKSERLTWAVLTSFAVLLPIPAGLLLLKNGFWTLVIETAVLFAAHILCVMSTLKDEGNAKQDKKALTLMFLLCPATSVYIGSVVIYTFRTSETADFSRLAVLFIGALILITGNYMPKFRPNSTLGIRVPWTLKSNINWTKTHRLGGKIWFVSGIVILLSALLPGSAMVTLTFVAICTATIVPVAYSYWLYKQHMDDSVPDPRIQLTAATVIFTAAPAVLIVAVLVIAFIGDVTVEYGDTSLTLNADLWPSETIEYSDIAKVSYRESTDVGSRNWGIGSTRMLVGLFENGEFGVYTRFTYTNCPSAVLVETSDGGIVVFNSKTEDETWQLYEGLAELLGKQ